MDEEEFVTAVHGITGFIQSVPKAWIDIFPDLKVASKKVIASAQANEVAEADAPAVQEGA